MPYGADDLVMTAAAVLAGAVNAMAGGGTLITFPAMTAMGVPPVAANVTNAVALLPGFIGAISAQRRDIAGQGRVLKALLPIAALGGAGGGALLLASGDRVFRAVVPFLILSASLLLAVQDRVRAFLLRRSGAETHSTHLGRAVVPVLFAAAYGGYFGAGLGVILLAVLGLFIAESFNRLNALKLALSFAANLSAALYFAATGPVIWHVALVMAAGALIGGAIGGRLAARIHPESLRRIVVFLGVGVGLAYLLR